MVLRNGISLGIRKKHIRIRNKFDCVEVIFEPERLGLILLPARQSSAEFVIIIMLSCQHPCRQGVSSCTTKRRDRREFSSISDSPEGMVAERPRKKGKRYFNCTSRKSRLHRPILLLSVINCDSDQLKQIPLYWGIFWLNWIAQGFFLDLWLYLIICRSTISRFWMCWGWKFIIFDERDIFLGPRGPTGTILVPVEIELVPRFGLPPSPQSPFNKDIFQWNVRVPQIFSLWLWC